MQNFEDFDVTQEPSENFEDFDVFQEPEAAAEPEFTIEALGGLSESADELTSTMQARDEIERRLMIEPGDLAFAAAEEGPAGFANIVGVGIGEKVIDGHPTGRLAVKVLVKEKMGETSVASSALAPETLGGVLVDVDSTGEISASAYTAKYRPAPGGVSIGNCDIVHAGTLGCLVTRAGRLFVLSNNHVMAVVNRGPVNIGIPQPGRLDGGVCPNDVIARLTQWVTIVFGGQCNFVDAAIAQTSPQLVDRRIIRPLGVRQPLTPPIVAPALNLRVQKSGRTTQYRRGFIDAVNVTVNISYAPLGGVARFCNQFRVRGIGGAFSNRGDSGSLVTTLDGNHPTGLLFAGNAESNVTFCNDIRRVLAAFGVAIVY